MCRRYRRRDQPLRWRRGWRCWRRRWRRLSIRLMKSCLLNIVIYICWIGWRRILLLLRFCPVKMRLVWKIRSQFWILNNKNKEKLKKKDFRVNQSSKGWWRISQNNKVIGNREFMNCRNVYEIRKNQYKKELRGKEETKRLLKLLLMRIRTQVNLRWEKISIFKSFGMLSWGKRWRKKWETPIQLMKHLKQLKRPLV